jgi:predicted  nucleic acid-binding Zn-ribbon protein
MPALAPGMSFGDTELGEVFPRLYTLPNGKLEPLTQLMSRSDVPLLIRAQENGIEVNATEGQHRVFAAFVRMIHPSGDRSGARVSPGDDGDRRVVVDRRRIAKQIERAARQRSKAIEKMEKRRAKTGARMEQIKIEATVKSETQEALEQEAENLSEQAERLAEQAEEIRERTERIEERAGRESERDKRADLERELLTLRHQAEALELQKNQLEDRAHAVEDRAREAEDQAREAENRLEELEDELRQAEQEATEEDNDDNSHASVDNPDSEWWNALQPALEAAMESLTGETHGEDAAETPPASDSEDE